MEGAADFWMEAFGARDRPVFFVDLVTVIAGDGTTADWLTKACSILPARKAKRLAHSLQAEVLIAEIKKGKLINNRTKGFGQYYTR